MDGKPRPASLPSDKHAPLINEYGWLWLNRDGSPTRLTENVYAQILGTNVTARERLDMYAYLLSGKTEFWRAHRAYAGIIHFVYLTCSYPGVYTADHFSDVTHLKLDPAFADYMGEAFKPLGLYINFFQPTLQAGTSRTYDVMMVNDDYVPRKGVLSLSLTSTVGSTMTYVEQPFETDALGNATFSIPLTAPSKAGKYTLKAEAKISGKDAPKPTISRRWVTIENEGK